MAKMAAKRNETVKKTLLFGFMLVSVSLVFLIWADGLIEHEPETPSYYRATLAVNDSMYVTLTAVARNYELGTGTPEGKNGHGNGGGGGDHEESTPVPEFTPTPKPTIDWDAVEQDQ